MNYREMFSQIVTNVSQSSPDHPGVAEELAAAYTFLKRSLGIGRSETPDPARLNIFEHSLKVAHHLSEWGLSLYVIKAGLLHYLCVNPKNGSSNPRALERIRNKIGPQTADILNRYGHLKAQLLYCEEQVSKGELVNEKFQAEYSPEAFYIVVAHRIEELLRDEEMPSGKTLQLAQMTMSYLIPEVKRQEAFYLVGILEDVCFKITNRRQYEKILAQVQEMQSMNNYSYQKFRNEMALLFHPDNPDLPPSLQNYKRYIRDFYSRPRGLSSLQRFISQTEYVDEPKKSLEKYGLALYSLFLIVKDPAEQEAPPESIFLKFYSDMMAEQYDKPRFTIHNFSKNTDYLHTAFLISDESNNFYFLNIRTESEYRRYRYGRVADLDQTISAEESSGSRIRVKKMDGNEISLVKGATVLDFAFAIHEQVGNNFHHAKVNDTTRPVHYQLQNGDRVEIFQNTPEHTITPDLNWLKHVKTNQAKTSLIKYFKTHYRLDTERLTVSNRYGKTLSVETDSTVLDYAFQVYEKKALHYVQGLVDGVACNMGQRLKPNEQVEIVMGEQPTAKIEWFKFVNTRIAKEILVDYFGGSL
ncbi:MAG: TGS domain-containing protein [Dorea sp.]|nr:TGS domain-containing protein [Dorea sp.]